MKSTRGYNINIIKSFVYNLTYGPYRKILNHQLKESKHLIDRTKSHLMVTKCIHSFKYDRY